MCFSTGLAAGWLHTASAGCSAGDIRHTPILMALVLAFRRPEFNKRQFFLALLACLAILILLVAAVAGVWWLISSVLAGRRIIGDCPSNLFLLSALMLFGACVGTCLIDFFRKRLGGQELSLAALSLWFVLSWLLALEISSGSYLLFWPLLLCLWAMPFPTLGTNPQHINPQPTGYAPSLLLRQPFFYLHRSFICSTYF